MFKKLIAAATCALTAQSTQLPDFLATAEFDPEIFTDDVANSAPGSRICVKNEAGFVLTWVMRDENTDQESFQSGKGYSAGFTQCMDIADQKNGLPKVKEGDKIMPVIHAILGKTNDASSHVIYQADPPTTVTFQCTGATLTYSCHRI